jgi:prolyl 4-hydroxylase
MCTTWALVGECDSNPHFMRLHCAPSCWTCELLDVSHRCPMDANAHQALLPSDLDRLFEYLIVQQQQQQQQQQPSFSNQTMTVHSRPTLAPGDTLETASYVVGGPWIVTWDNFLSDEEAASFIHWGEEEIGFTPSHTEDRDAHHHRTSSTAWCADDCARVHADVIQRMEAWTGIPETHAEYPQLLRYRTGEYYNVHHDYIPYHLDRPPGPRILTLYVYLNDVEQGGATHFPALNITIQPKRGRLVLWPNVMSQDPYAHDPRTIHQSMPVTEGHKYGANVWIHMRDYKAAHAMRCI